MFVAEITTVLAPEIRFTLKFNWAVEGLKDNILVETGAPLLVTEICPTEVTFCTKALIGKVETEVEYGLIAGLTNVTTGGGVVTTGKL